MAAWLCCHGVSREMVLPRIIRADGLVPGSAPGGWGGRGVRAGSGHCRHQASPCPLSPATPQRCLATGPGALPASPLLVSQTVPSTRWGEWEQTPLRRRWSASTSRRRTTGSPCPPCPPPATGHPPSCRATRSSSWVGGRAERPSGLPQWTGGGFPPRLLAHPKLTPCRPCPGTAAGHCWRCRLPLGVPAASASRPCAGGRQGKLPVTSFEALDLETRSWTRYPSVPSRRAFAACAAADGVFFSLGGLQQPGPHNFYSRPHFVNTVEMFDPVQGEPRRPGWGLQRGVWGAMLTASALQVPGASPAAPSA